MEAQDPTQDSGARRIEKGGSASGSSGVAPVAPVISATLPATPGTPTDIEMGERYRLNTWSFLTRQTSELSMLLSALGEPRPTFLNLFHLDDTARVNDALTRQPGVAMEMGTGDRLEGRE